MWSIESVFGVLACCLVAMAATEVKEARYLDDNTLKAIFDLALQSQSHAKHASPKESIVEIKPRFVPYSQKEKLTVKGERQTHIPLPLSLLSNNGNGEFAIYTPTPSKTPATSIFPAMGKEPQTVDIKPPYVAPPAAASLQQLLPHFALNGYAAPWPLQLAAPYNSPYAYSQRSASTPAFIIINPANYPTYHYHNGQSHNQSRPRATAAAASEVTENDPLDNDKDGVADTYDAVDDDNNDGDRVDDVAAALNVLKAADAAQTMTTTTTTAAATAETEPIFVTLPEGGSDTASLVGNILGEARMKNGKDHPLLELLLQHQQQQHELHQDEPQIQKPRKRIQERVAAIYFRNYHSNRK